MQINEIKLKNFRNHTNRTFAFDDKLTLIVGQNGSGKTNILEAIYVLATAKSQRARYDKDLINYDHKFCTLNGKVLLNQDEYALELQIIKQDDDTNYSGKKAKINKVVKSISGFAGVFNAVLFTPEDISIITGTPSDRRRFLDLILSQSDKNYRHTLNNYLKAIRQRNSLLEQINKEGRGYNQMEFWDQQILTHGEYIQDKRTELIEFANDQLKNLIHGLDKPKSEAFINYKQNKISHDRLDKYHDREIAAKTTLVGPHRDDFEIALNNYNVAEFGSRGQQRTTILSLKLIEIAFIEKAKGERPVLLLDDIFSELDEKHRQAVLDTVYKQQTIITSAETESVLGTMAGKRIDL